MRTPRINQNPTPAVPVVPQTDWLQRKSNLGDVDSVVLARANLGLGSAAVLSVPATPATVSSAGQVVRGDDPRLGAGSPTELSNNDPVEPGTAGPGVGVTASRHDHKHPNTCPALAVTENSTKQANTAWVRNFLASAQRVTLGTVAAFWAVTKSGGGAESFGPLGIRLSCGAEASLVRVFSTTGNSPVARGSNTEIINFSKRVGISFKLAKIFANANSTARLTIGKVTGDGHGALARKSFGFIVENLTLKGIVHNGTAQIVGAVGFTLAGGTIYALHAISDGAGNVSFFVNDTLLETVAGGPTGNSSSQGGVMFELDNNASADSNSVAISPVDLIFPA